MQIVSLGDNFHEMSNRIGKNKKISIRRLLNYPENGKC